MSARYEHPDTIYTGDLDRRNDLLWIGDGEERSGTVTALDVFWKEPTPTPTRVPTETPTVAPETTPSPTPDPTPRATTVSADGPGFGVVLATLALAGVAFLVKRKR